MDIKVLGPGCHKCKTLYGAVETSLQQLGITATLVKIEKIEEIMAYQILMTPALVIGGVVKVAGRIPSDAEITNWLTTAAAKE